MKEDDLPTWSYAFIVNGISNKNNGSEGSNKGMKHHTLHFSRMRFLECCEALITFVETRSDQ